MQLEFLLETVTLGFVSLLVTSCHFMSLDHLQIQFLPSLSNGSNPEWWVYDLPSHIAALPSVANLSNTLSHEGAFSLGSILLCNSIIQDSVYVWRQLITLTITNYETLNIMNIDRWPLLKQGLLLILLPHCLNSLHICPTFPYCALQVRVIIDSISYNIHHNIIVHVMLLLHVPQLRSPALRVLVFPASPLQPTDQCLARPKGEPIISS